MAACMPANTVVASDCYTTATGGFCIDPDD